MNHDVINDKYGRLYHLPYELSQLGHTTFCYCLNYTSSPTTLKHSLTNPDLNQYLQWNSYDTGFLGVRFPLYLIRIVQHIKREKPDFIMASSDMLHCIIARIVSKITSIPYIIDLYDNYSSFGMRRIPFIVKGYNWALQSAHTIFTVSNTLNRKIQQKFNQLNVVTIESTISEGSFFQVNKTEARKKLGLPENKILVGTAGSLSKSRGTDHLYKAFEILKSHVPDIHLVLAGPIAGNPPPASDDVIYLGTLQHDTINYLFNSLDVAIICMKEDEFGKYAFPQKGYEILSCKVPVVSSDVGALRELFVDYPECLYQADSSRSLADKIATQISSPIIPYISVPTWKEQAKKIERELLGKLGQSK